MFFSFVIPVYNRQDVITRAINSCLAQTFDDYEIIIIDDASTDNTVNLIKSHYLSSDKVTLLVNEKNMGVCPTRQRGIDVASGDWIIFFDSDNEMFPNALEIMKKSIDAVSNDVKRMDFVYKYDFQLDLPDSHYYGRDKFKITWNDYRNGIYENVNILFNEGPHCYHKDVLRKLRYSYDNLRMNEVEFNFDFMHSFNWYHSGEPIGIYHTDANNRLSKKFDVSENVKSLRISAENLIKKYGKELKQYRQKDYRWISKSYVYYCLTTLNRRSRLKSSLDYLKQYPNDIEVISSTMLSLVSVRLLIWIDKLRVNIFHAKR